MSGERNSFRFRFCISLIRGLGAIALTGTLPAAEMDLSKLPPPATNQISFSRDIKPIFDVSCIRCHGPEKPKSGFRLDNRVAALKGGEDGVDILPGQSSKSPLIHYTARLVPDMEMPPDGKGDPLTPSQISLLRAWIDQGALWEGTGPTNLFDVSVSPTMGGTTVSGNSHKFREHYWIRDGFDGGLERFELFQQNGPDTKVSVTGHALLDDARITLNIDRNELGFIHSGWDQYRKYYDDNGGYPLGQDPNYPQRLGSDLYLDIGKAWIDFGLTLPQWPRMVLGYEYDYKRGEEAVTSWGSDLAAGDARNLAPASKQLNEGVHIIKFDLDAEVQGITIEDRYRGEFYNLNSRYTNLAARASVAQDARDKYRSLQNANSLRLEKKINDWLFTSGGYFYSKLNAEDSFTDATISNDILYLATVPRIDLTRESHIFNLNGLLGPFDGLTFSTGAQSEWTRQHGFGDGNLNGIAYTRPPGSNLAINPATLASDYDQSTVSETAGIRYSKIPFTTLFADARLKQESIGQVDTDIQPDASFLENPSYSSQGSDFRTGFTTSPWQRVSFSSHYRRYEDDSHYKTNDVPQPLGGYPGLISRRDQIGNEIEAKLVLRAAKWLTTTLTYQIVRMDYREETRPAYDVDPVIIHSDGGYILAGRSDSHIYSFGTTITPHRRFALTGTLSYQDSKTSTENAGLVPPYKGGVYSALISSTFIVNQSTDLSLNYSMSLADYSQDQSLFLDDSPPPLGIRYQQHAVQASLAHRFTKNLSTRLRYAYYRYDEPTLGTANDYVAHSIFATMVYRFP